MKFDVRTAASTVLVSVLLVFTLLVPHIWKSAEINRFTNCYKQDNWRYVPGTFMSNPDLEPDDPSVLMPAGITLTYNMTGGLILPLIFILLFS
jgi:hypothetical protein